MRPAKLMRVAGIAGALLVLVSFISKQDDPLDKLVSSLQTWYNSNPQEKIYLHTDKPYYLVGDTIWFKAYVTVGSKHQLSGLSGAMYVDLIAEGDSVARSLKLPITSGMSVGSFILSTDEMREGNYRIRAYTQWMRNAGPDYFYDRTFTIGNSIANTVFAKIDYVYTKDGSNTRVKAVLKYTDDKGQPYAGRNVHYDLRENYKILTTGGGKTNEAGELTINLPNAKPGQLLTNYLFTKMSVDNSYTVAKTFPIKTASFQTDVQFFPESGNLVNGVKSKVAFKATGTNALGVAISGVVVDNDNKEVAQLDVKHLGMGYFFLTPEAGKTYSAKITYPDGGTNTIPLPAAMASGYVMSVFPTDKKDSVLVRINTNTATLKNSDRKLAIIGQSGGSLYFSLNVPISSEQTSLYLPVANIPSGILQFTLFSSAGNPLNERIVFIQNNDNINLKISSPKQTYSRRENVALTIDATDRTGKPIGGNFSVSVVSESAVPSDEANENSIFSQLLLSSDIKGYVEKPNYYFYNVNDDTRADLDVLMLTQGYRRFAWKNLLSGGIAAPTYKAEKLVNEVSGTVMGYNKKPVVGGRVILINNKLKFVRDTVTDANGRFRFGNLLITDGVDFSIQGTTAKGSKRVKTTVDQVKRIVITPNNNIGDVNADIPDLIKASIENSRKQDEDLAKNGMLTRARQIREVEIRAARQPRYGAGNINESQADEVFRPDSRMPCATLRECLEEMPKRRVRFDYEFDNGGDCGPVWIPRFGKVTYSVLIDNVLIQPCEYQSIFLDNTDNIAKVYFSHDSPAITAKLLGGLNAQRGAAGAVMAIYTKNGAFRMTDDPSIVYYDPRGYSFTKEFYSPRYDTPASPAVADLRSTVYWNPRVLTKAAGETKVSYFNGDEVGTYRVTIEGIDADGMLGRQVFRYTVQ